MAANASRQKDAETHYDLGNALRGQGRLEEAAAAYRRAIEIRPDLAPAQHNLGVALQMLERFADAAEAYHRVLAIVPDAAETVRNLGMVLHKLGRLGEATAAFRRALAIRPDWPGPYTNLVTALIEAGDAAAAVAACDDWLALLPGDIEAMALKCIALNEAGERERLGYLLDFDRFVSARVWAAAPGYASLEDFNAALVRHVLAHPTLKVPPEDDPTYHNPELQITEELLGESEGPMAALETMMHTAIDDYRREVLVDPSHPFVANFPKRWRISAWGTLLEGKGNLVSHIHLEGYLGGCYYPKLPDAFGQPGHGEAGWFELGAPPDELATRAAPVARAVQPMAGKMLLFPGYFYHRTIPFEAPGQRVSIAFDVVAED